MSIISTAIGMVAMWCFTELVGLFYLVSGCFVAFFVILSAFAFNEIWTFSHRGRAGLFTIKLAKRFAKFILSKAAGFLICISVLALFTEVVGWHYLISNFFAIGASFIWNYTTSTFWVWAREESIGEKRREYSENVNLRLLLPTYYSRYTEVLKMVEKQGVILDVGCEDGFYSQGISNKNNQVVGIDVNIDFIDFLTKEEQPANLSYLVAGAETLPFKDETFDTVLCIDVIEHVDNDEQVLSEVYRVLKPNGQLLISVPNYNFPFTYDPINFILKRFNKHLPIGIWGFGHKRIYSFGYLKSLLEKYKFNLVKTRYLTHDFAASFENYLPTFLSTIFASVGVKARMRSYRPDRFSRTKGFIYQCAYNITKKLTSVDNRLFDNISRSVGMAILARKVIGH